MNLEGSTNEVRGEGRQLNLFALASVQQHHLVFLSTSTIRQWLGSASGVSSLFASPLFAVGAVSTVILAVGADVVRMVGGPDVGTEGMVVR